MPEQTKKNETLYRGRSKWLSVPYDYVPKSGEHVIETDDVVKKTPRNGFEIHYLTYLFDLFDKLGGKKYIVLKYIMKNKNSENQLIITVRELAKACNVSTKTVIETLNLLKDANLIETRTGAIMLNPKLSHRGDDRKERYLLQKFVTFADEDNVAPGQTSIDDFM